MIDGLIKGAGGLVWVLRIAAGALLLASVALNFANIIGRYFFNAPISWAEEIMLFLMIGCVFCGLGVVAWTGRQIRMDVFIHMLPDTPRHLLELAAEILFVVIAIVLVMFAIPVVLQLYDFDQRSTAANFPLVIPQAMLPIGMALAALLVTIRILAFNRRRRSDGAPATSKESE